MIGINSVTIIGNIGTISDINITNNGAKFVNLTIATTETFYSTNNEKKSDTQWHNVMLWNNMTELQKMLTKGDLLYVEGRLNYRRKSPTQIFTEIVAKNIRILNKKNYGVVEDVTIEKEDFSSDMMKHINNSSSYE
jgi:single-strand DNA-binding protein